MYLAEGIYGDSADNGFSTREAQVMPQEAVIGNWSEPYNEF